MSWKLTALVGGVGVLIGAALPLVWSTPAAAPARVPARSTPAATEPPAETPEEEIALTDRFAENQPCDLAEVSAERDALRQELEGVQAELAWVTARNEYAEGVPLSFPEALDEPYTPERFPDVLAQAIAAVDGGELVSVDCGEFPCAATVARPQGTSLDAMDAALADAGVNPEDRWSTESMVEDPVSGEVVILRHLIMLPWADAPDDMQLRLSTRIQQVQQRDLADYAELGAPE